MGRRGVSKGPRMINEIVRLKTLGLSKRKISKALAISRNTVDRYLAGGVDKPEPYHAPWSESIAWQEVFAWVNEGKALSDYHESRVESPPPYTSFWREFRRRYPQVDLEMHRHHPPGERCEIDFKGDAPALGYFDRPSGMFVQCRLYGAVSCFSQLFFSHATHAEKQVDWLSATAEAFRYFGGVPLTLVMDNAKANVTKAHRYDPDINKEFTHFCSHFGTAPIAARPCKPKDKNLIECLLGVFWRWARRRIKERRFYSLGELNQYLLELADEFNSRTMRKYGQSRRERFNAAEKPELLPLPTAAYAIGEWKTAKPHPDCHVQVLKNFYSVPYTLRGSTLEVRITNTLVEAFSGLERVACHFRAGPNTHGRYFTKLEHLPESQRAVKEATPTRVIEDAENVGPFTHKVIKHLILDARHPLMLLRRAQGILRLEKRYSKTALEQACKRVVDIGVNLPRLADLEDIIKCNVDPNSATVTPIKRNPNPFLRGQGTWASGNIEANMEEKR